jgi:hypothetical protein
MLILKIVGALCFGLLMRIGYKAADLPNACILAVLIVPAICEPPGRLSVPDYIFFTTTVVGTYLPSWIKIKPFNMVEKKLSIYLQDLCDRRKV